MQTLEFKTTIHATPQKVWEVMLDDKAFLDWSGAFNPGSYYEGSWKEGSTIRFLGKENDGTSSGMIGKIHENRPGEKVTIIYQGHVDHDEENTDTNNDWYGAREVYEFADIGGATELVVQVDTTENLADELTVGWNKALARLKEIVEAA